MSVNNALTLENAQPTTWQKQDTIWMLSLYGTAIGAGTLFLPINAGLHGIWPLIIMAILALPMTYYSHRALCRFVLSGSGRKNITEVVDEHFGPHAGKLLTFLYLFTIYPILLMYSVAITNTTNSFIVHQMGSQAPPRAILALILILSLLAIVRFGQQMIIRSMSVLVYPFVIALLSLALYLVPYWNGEIFREVSHHAGSSSQGFWMTMWLIIPVMVFSFNHSPIISSFALQQKIDYGDKADEKCITIMKYSHLMMVCTVMFFVLSCVLSLSPQDLALAKQQNISILSYLANHFQTPTIAYIAPLIAFVAISKSFLGHYLGAKEALYGILAKIFHQETEPNDAKKIHRLIEVIIILSCWIVATINPSILGMIETLGGPVIAMLLFLMPMYAIAKVPAMRKYYHLFSNGFIVAIGLIALSATVYGLI
jgi:serine transporter